MADPGNITAPPHTPRLVALELTRRCMLRCRHCRAEASEQAGDSELSRDEWFKVLDGIAGLARPVIILSGGEPMMRQDLYDIAAHAAALGLPVALGTCGMLLDAPAARKLAACGVRTVAISLDGASADSHDAFRGAAGAFDSAVAAIRAAKDAALTVQVNTTLTRENLPELPAILELAAKLGAETFNPFLLVPTGRGKDLAGAELPAAEYERTLVWLADRQDRGDIRLRVTCAPHYQRVLAQRAAAGGRQSRGCLAGLSFVFVSCRGVVRPCGFLQVDCGDLRGNGYDFAAIWRGSPVFLALRDRKSYRGKCGRCEFYAICGGCRARAYAATGDYLGDEPLCPHEPRPRAAAGAQPVEPDGADKQLIWLAQTQFPVVRRPFDVLGPQAGVTGSEAARRLQRMRESRLIRRMGAVFDTRRLRRVSTLVAATVPPERLEEVAAIISTLPGVTHNYGRRHERNLWFTLSATSQQELERLLVDITARCGLSRLLSLPAEMVYKINAVFAPPGLDVRQDAAPPPPASVPLAEMDAAQRQLAAVLGGDLPVAEDMFDGAAEQVGRPVEEVIDQIKRWQTKGVIRRFGAVVSHRLLGYVGNGMAVFNAPQERIDELGRMLAAMPCVSHCYRRRPASGFDYNLFAMVHARGERELRRVVGGFAAEARLKQFEVLVTQREFKKTSPRPFA